MASVVVQLNEGSSDKHRSVLRNIRNLKEEMPDLQIELVVHGEGVALVTRESSLAEQVTNLLADGLTIAVCKNTLKMKTIDPADLLFGITLVNAGIAEIIRCQMEGYAYVKP